LDDLAIGNDSTVAAAESATARPTTIAKVQVNDGAIQRSMVTSLRIDFNEQVTIPYDLQSVIQLQRVGPGSLTGLVKLNLTQRGDSITVTFNDRIYAPGKPRSLIDGNYVLTIAADKIQSQYGPLDGNGDGVVADDLSFGLHRLFGDGNGDRRVDSQDMLLLRQTFGTGLNLAFDYNGDGNVSSCDFTEFRKRFGLSI